MSSVETDHEQSPDAKTSWSCYHKVMSPEGSGLGDPPRRCAVGIFVCSVRHILQL